MTSLSWICKLFARPLRTIRKTAARRQHSFVPGLDLLEDRTVPAVATRNPPPLVPTEHFFASSATASRRLASSKAQRKGPSLISVTPLSNTTMLLKFNKKLRKNTVKRAAFLIPGLNVVKAQLLGNHKSILLTTSPQEDRPYNVFLNNLRAQDGLVVSAPRADATVAGMPPAAPPVVLPAAAPPLDTTPPRVVGAISTANTKLLVSFSEPMADSALNPLNYSVVQTTVNQEAGLALVRSVRFLDDDPTTVELTTSSQNELNYTVTVVNVKDPAGNPLAPPQLSPGGLMIDPSRATFQGTPPAGDQIVDTDGDGLSDNDELRGWTVVVKEITGRQLSRHVTSDPFQADTDGEGFTDDVEAQLRLDPRDADTDDDRLTDFQEFNEIFSDHLNQDSDGDGVDDGTEFLGFFSSPTHADTDGDQIPDGEEITNPNRNPLVADLPTPAIEVGDINLALDVRFTETTATGTRQLESKTVSSTLSQSQNKTFSHADSNTQEAMTKLSASTEFTIDPSLFGFIVGGGTEFKTTVGLETGWTGSWTSETTNGSEQATQQAYEDSLTTNVETSQDATVERSVAGAKMQVTVFLKNASNMAFNIRDLQLTAFIYEPSDPTRLIPVATLVPENAPEGGYNLGPLVPERGPFIFASDTVFPNQVENLMKSPGSLVFRISNFDVIDEAGRNFAFSSRDVSDRTTNLVIDLGGADSDGDGEGDLTEYNRVAVSSGRIVIDTNNDGKVDDDDRRVVFDRLGVHVGMTLRQALFNMRLKEYDESVTPSNTLSETELRNSYSIVKDAATGYERIFRIRTVARETNVPKAWEILTAEGIERPKTLDEVILTPRSDIKLAFVQDLDQDRLPGHLEFLHGTSDILKDTDSDGLDDRFEALKGWTVDLGPLGSRRVFSSPTLADSDRDGLSDTQEAPGNLMRDAGGLITSATRINAADYVTDPSRADTDADTVSDFVEVTGYDITLRNPPAGGPATVHVTTNPELFDTDGDTASDGLERRLGGNPTNPNDRDRFADDDRDGLSNIEETTGWTVTHRLVSTAALTEGATFTVQVTSDPSRADTDGDGILDGEEQRLGLHPRQADTDGDGLTDFQEVRGFQLRDQGVIRTNPRDVDSDNDMRSDGEEAELTDVEAKRWIVRPGGKTPYRVYSDPLQSDADFDGVVDGDEFTWNNALYRSDPTKANTDGDSRTDGEERLVNLNPLVEDFLVTVVYRSLKITADGDGGNNAGEFRWSFDVRLPSETSVTGLAAGATGVSSFGNIIQLLPDYQLDRTRSLVSGFVSVVQIRDDDSNLLDLARWLPLEQRSTTFSVATNQRFSIEGEIRELDANDVVKVNFGGLEGAKATKVAGGEMIRGVFEGSSLTRGSITELTFGFDASHNVILTGSTDGGKIAGELKVMVIVS